ncbi:hypothetical protein MLD38_034406 [Melastoma candidum]|uniref:Uncharacterized protein n=1 Tax=Melastoma candidum TaxID=119954 RepID=A0ACB9MCF0_9MYRT|nr:hypothetical protein MLD38_034406 [Melastoma candidum]
MADPREQLIRFRIPWLSSSSPPPSAPAEPMQEQRPSEETPTVATEPIPSQPIARPAFRPTGVAPVEARIPLRSRPTPGQVLSLETDLMSDQAKSVQEEAQQKETSPPTAGKSQTPLSAPEPLPLLDASQRATLLPSVTDQAEATTAPFDSSKPQKYNRFTVDRKEEAPLESSSHDVRRSKQIKFAPTKVVATASSPHSVGTHLSSVGSSSSFPKETKGEISKLVHLITSGKANTALTVEESVDIITLAGENTGATMLLTSKSSKKKERIHIRRNYRSDPDESVEGMTDAEEYDREACQAEGEGSENCTFLNSNVQGMNNSIALDSSVSEESPGIHFKWAANAEPLPESRNTIGSRDAFRDQFNVTQTEEHTHKPTIRRRCLRGLLMESSDSDDGKPRRHGCRYGCGLKKAKEKLVG